MSLSQQADDQFVMRIVYDGPPNSGKTTNLRHLCGLVPKDVRSDIESPGPESECTLFFDWFDISEVSFLGRRIRCQIISVPGRLELVERRRYLLQLADVVVFVGDSRASETELNRRLMKNLRETLGDKLTNHPPVNLLLQANKQDLENAHDPDALADHLELPRSTPVIAARAHVGQGVKATFLLAFEKALQRVKTLITESGGKQLLPIATPEEIYEHLLSLPPTAGNLWTDVNEALSVAEANNDDAEAALSVAESNNDDAEEPVDAEELVDVVAAPSMAEPNNDDAEELVDVIAAPSMAEPNNDEAEPVDSFENEEDSDENELVLEIATPSDEESNEPSNEEAVLLS
ncbi:MAG: GTPase domain-containing protein, partial [Planctomycetales bacterium]